MRQLLCTLCLVAVVGIIALTGDSAQARANTTGNSVAPAAITAPSVLDRWALMSLVISVGALGIALSGTARRLELRPVLGSAGERSQRFVQQVARALATRVAERTAAQTPPATSPAFPVATDTAALEELMESIGARYLIDLQSLHGIVEQAWATEVAGRDERILALMRQIETTERERDLLAEKVCDLEREQSHSTSALTAARDELERRLANLGRQQATTDTPASLPASNGQSPARRRNGGGSRTSRGQRGKGGR